MNFPSIESSLHVIRNRGFRPQLAIDIGAYHGDWTVMFKGVFPESYVVMVEAQQNKEAKLSELCRTLGPSVQFYIGLLGAKHGEMVRFSEMETGSSVLEEISPFPRAADERMIVTLDSILEFAGAPVDFLKLDVQGYELEVLKGATKSLAAAQAVLMEASLVPINAGCPLIGDVMSFMSAAGFRLFDFCSQIRRRDGVLWQTDLLFVKEGGPLVPDARLTKENWG